MKNLLKISLFLAALLVIVLISACTTQKVRGEYSGLKKVYHNTTQRYNGYYNATVLLEESKLALTDQHVDNYNKILPVFAYTKADNPKAEAASLDEAMKKVSVAVNLHRGADWTDDCYLLLGQAQYLKQEYESAEETFEFMEVEFSSDPKKRGSLSKAAKERAKKSKAEKEQYKKDRLRELAEEKKERDNNRKEQQKEKKKEREDASKQRAKDIKAKKKARDKERKEREKEMKAYKKAVAIARKKGTKPPPRPGRKTTVKKEEEAPEEKEEKVKKEKEPKEEKEKEEKPEKEKKELVDNNDPENYFLKHRPVYRDGILWLARTYIERDNWTLANNKLNQLENDSKTSAEVAKQIPIIRAYYFTEQKKYDEAIPHLEAAIKLEEDRFKKARYAYIIAQIKDKSGDTAGALAGFERVLKFRPEYIMEFSARLNMLNSRYNSGQATADKTTKELKRLLKDIKNEEYQDQIYFTLAQVAFADNKTDEAISFLESSISVPSSNTANQAEAYYRLANIYLEREDYVNAKSYFDSTIGLLAKNDERYDEAAKLAENLAPIAENLQVIELQDSLLRLSKLSAEELRQRAFDIKKADNERRRQAILDKLGKSDGTNTALAGNGQINRLNAKASSFFAYADDRTIKKGNREFLRTWGERPLEDNWRLGDEVQLTDQEEDELDNLAETIITDEDVQQMFKDVPKNPADREKAQRSIEEAMFNLGRLYREKLAYNQKAVDVLEELLKRNPQTEFEPDALYYLYLAHRDLNNIAQSNEAKNKLLQDYAETTFARVIQDPDYVKKSLDQDYQLNQYYNETYATFKKGDYKVVKAKLDGVPNKFGPKNSLSPRFALLGAMTTGNLNGKEAYIAALKDVIAKHPKTPEETRAKEILRLLGVKTNRSAASGTAEEGTYVYEEDKLHYMIVVFKNKDISLTDVKVQVSDYHKQYHKLDKLRISNIYLGGADSKLPLIVVRRFKDKTKAMEYYEGVQKNSGDFVKSEEYDLFPVTQANYRQILKSKSLDGYQDFFDNNYFD